MQADVVAVAARVGGTVQHVLVEDNQHVTAGQVLVELDDSDYAARVQQAEGELAEAEGQEQQAEAQERIVMASAQGGFTSARAEVLGSSARVATADAQIAASRAGLRRAEAQAKNADVELERARKLLAEGAIPQQQFDGAALAADTAHAAVQQAQADVAGADESKRAANTGVAEAQGKLLQSRPVDAQIAAAHGASELARGKVTAAQAALDQARLQLSYTRVVAPADGRVSSLTARVAQIVAPAQPFGQFVPDHGYVTANFKETQTGDMHPGQRATISIDAYPHRSFEGRVESLSAGTGARLLALAAEQRDGELRQGRAARARAHRVRRSAEGPRAARGALGGRHRVRPLTPCGSMG